MHDWGAGDDRRDRQDTADRGDRALGARRRQPGPGLPEELRALGRRLGELGADGPADRLTGGPSTAARMTAAQTTAAQTMAERVLARILAETETETAPCPDDSAGMPEPGRFRRVRVWARDRLDWSHGWADRGDGEGTALDVLYPPGTLAHPARRSRRFLPARRGRR
ncbi:hypothetical protein [Streptomyces sp. NBC_00859]|uniref:hypothetical protein n=1 Tax=Streptomyces sp. NBC_00859 TaxID=2903682 RepID=UPI003863A7EB|nr:hypothetical protein OG584_12715 [Streptomyces sp. NBC_00859]